MPFQSAVQAADLKSDLASARARTDELFRMVRPGSLKEIYAYNRRVRENLDKVLDDVPEEMIHVAIEHRLMHAETFAYILHNLPHDRKIGPIPPARTAGSVPHRMIEIPAGHATLGRD